VLAKEFEERGEVGRKQQAGSSSTACHRTFPMTGLQEG
jgi:hypothetical protein